MNHIDGADLAKLRIICKRLYAEKPLSGDERRDLPNALNVLLGRIETAEIVTEEAVIPGTNP